MQLSMFDQKSGKNPKESIVPKIIFLGEQEGLAENELKDCLVEFSRVIGVF